LFLGFFTENALYRAYLYKIVKHQGGSSVKSVIVGFRIEKQLLEKFDRLCRDQGFYIRSEGLRKAVITVLKRGKFDS